MDDLCPGRDLLFNAGSEIVEAGRGNREGDLLENDSVAAFALLPGCDHVWIVLIRRQDFVTALELYAELNRFESLAGVARDGNFFRIAAEGFRKPPAHSFDTRIENIPHVIGGAQIFDFEVAYLGVHHDFGSWR